MKYQSFLTRKYLFSRFIPWAAVLAVAFGVFALIVVLSVMEGFKVEYRDRIRGSLAHISVFSNRYAALYDLELLEERVLAVPHVEAVAPQVEAQGLYKVRTLDVCQIKGVDPLAEARIGEFAHYLLRDDEIELLRDQSREIRHLPDGRQPLSDDEILHLFSLERRRQIAREAGLTGFELSAPPQPVVVGIEVIKERRLRLGDVVQISSFSPLTQEPRVASFLVVGAFQTGLQEQNVGWMFMPIRACQEFLGLFDERKQDYLFSSLSVQLDDYSLADTVLTEIQTAVRNAIDVPLVFARTWEDQRRTLLQAVEIEKTIITFMMMIVVAFAGMMIFLILTLMIIEKTRDFGIIRALGATSSGVVGIIFRLGAFLVALGLLIGGVSGYFFVANLNPIHDAIYAATGFRLFPPEIYYLTEIPAAFRFWDLLKVIGSACAFGFLGSLIPAYWASRVNPIKALSHD